MTPQTLVNDLMKENCDPRDIVLLVVGELDSSEGSSKFNFYLFHQTKPTGRLESMLTIKPYDFLWQRTHISGCWP
jgi:hypothetical protein